VTDLAEKYRAVGGHLSLLEVSNLGDMFLARSELCISHAWSVPTREAIERVCEWSPLIEVGAGTGYWASLIAAAGGDIVATDLNPPGTYRVDDERGGIPLWHSWSEGFFDVAEMNAIDAAEKYADRALLISWPELGRSWAADAVAAYYEAGGQRVVYVGEVDGCCGTDELFVMLGLSTCLGCLFGDDDDGWSHNCDVPALFAEVAAVALPRWQGMHDALYLTERI